MAAILVLLTESPEAQLGDVDFARWLEYGDLPVIRFDPEAAYLRGGMAGLEKMVLSIIEEHHVTILVYPLGMEFDFCPTFFRDKLKYVFCVLLLGDDEHYFDISHRYYAQCFDLILSTNPLCERYRLYGKEAWFIPGAFNSNIFCPLSGTEKDIDISFVGAMKGKVGRSNYLKALMNAELDISVFGMGTTQGVVSRDRAIDIYRRSKINLNFTGSSLFTPLDWEQSINRRVRQVKGRCSMIALCGAFVLSEYAPGIEKLFNIGNEIDVFHDEEELIEKARFYLTHESLREEMAVRAYARAASEYDEAKFGRQLALSLKKRAADNAYDIDSIPVFFDRPFWAAFGAWRFKYLVMFLLSCKPGLFIKELMLLLKNRRCNFYSAIWFGGLGLHVLSRKSQFAFYISYLVKQFRRFLQPKK